MQIIPSAPTPVDGSCTANQNTFSYQQTENGNSYTISFCLGNTTGTLTAGPKCLTPGGIVDMDCSVSAPVGFSVNIGGLTDSEIAYSVEQTTDGGYILAGETSANDQDFYIAKLDSSGEFDTGFGTNGIVTFGGAGTQIAHSIQPTSDGGYIVAGSTNAAGNTDFYLAKLTSNGSLDSVFDTDGLINIGDTGDQVARSVRQTSDGGYIVAGSNTSSNNGDMYVIKLTAAGATSWSTNIGSVGDPESAMAIRQTSDGGYIVAGNGWGSMEDIYVAKINSSGDLDPAFDTDGIITLGDASLQYASDVEQTADGGYIIIGHTSANGNDMYITKITAAGTLDTNFSSDGILEIGGTMSDTGKDIDQTADGGYIAIGSFMNDEDRDMYIIKLTSAGAFDTAFSTDGIIYAGGVGYESGWSIAPTTDGGYIAVGDTEENAGDVYVVKMDDQGNYEE
jgi:uncharacterized delta-60 repeat protein